MNLLAVVAILDTVDFCNTALGITSSLGLGFSTQYKKETVIWRVVFCCQCLSALGKPPSTVRVSESPIPIQQLYCTHVSHPRQAVYAKSTIRQGIFTIQITYRYGFHNSCSQEINRVACIVYTIAYMRN